MSYQLFKINKIDINSDKCQEKITIEYTPRVQLPRFTRNKEKQCTVLIENNKSIKAIKNQNNYAPTSIM
jgi:hypothetical protein